MKTPEHDRPGPPLRLTRRGRGVLIGAAAGGLLVTFWLTGALGAQAGDTGRHPVQRPVQHVSDQGERTPTVTVEPGESLWEIAVRADPAGDPWTTIRRIIDLNDLDGTFIQPGQELRMPAR